MRRRKKLNFQLLLNECFFNAFIRPLKDIKPSDIIKYAGDKISESLRRRHRIRSPARPEQRQKLSMFILFQAQYALFRTY